MKENFCDIQKNMQAQKELEDTKNWSKILFCLFVIVLIMFFYMCYWYGLEKSNTEHYKSLYTKDNVKLSGLTGDTILCKVDTSMINDYYIVKMDEKKIIKILIDNGYTKDTVFINPYIEKEQIINE